MSWNSLPQKVPHALMLAAKGAEQKLPRKIPSKNSRLEGRISNSKMMFQKADSLVKT